MKSLDQIASTGIALNQTNTPGDATNHYIVSQPGSYYLTSNLGVTKTNGIHVTVAGVMIDLNGFQISRSSGSGGDGILIDLTAHRCVVKHGDISGNFATGIDIANLSPPVRGGVYYQLTVSGCTNSGLKAGNSWRIEGCQVHDNPGIGIGANGYAVIVNCTAMSNGSTGISAGAYSTVTNCAAAFNSIRGISGSNGCVLTACSATSNTGAGLGGGDGSTFVGCKSQFNSAEGISMFDRCTVSHCSVTGNTGIGIQTNGTNDATIQDSTIGSNFGGGVAGQDGLTIAHCTISKNGSGSTGSGIAIHDNCTITGCSVNANRADGIVYANGNFIYGNTANGNAANGLHGTGTNNTIDTNKAYKNVAAGIVQSGVDADFTMRNVSFGNPSAQYLPVTSGNYFGPYSLPGTATSPWANF